MFQQYFKIALRNYRKNKFYTLVNVFGLATGITTFILIALFIHYHLTFDRFHKNYKRIYRIDRIVHLADHVRRWDQTWFPISQTLKKDYPEIEQAVVARPIWGEFLSSSKEKTFFEDYGLYAENSIFDIFSYEFIEGSPQNALTETFSMVLSEKLAKKYFPDAPALGKIIRVRNKYDFRITGVYRNLPENTMIYGRDYISTMKSFDYFHNDQTEGNWDYINFNSFILLYDHASVNIEELNKKYTDVIRNFVKDTRDEVHLTKLTDIHLFGYDDNKTHILLIVYGILAILALVVTSINFINLATAQSTTRAREIGIKKVVGSRRSNLIKQFLTESVVITSIGLLLAFFLAYLVIPTFSQVVNAPLTLSLISHWQLILFIVVFIIIVGIVSGFYPAIFLSSFNPAEAIKNPLSMRGKKSFLRKSLVTFQFVLTSMIIFSTIMVFEQFTFMKNKYLGFNANNVLILNTLSDENEPIKDYRILTDEIKRIPGVLDITISGYLPFHGYTSWPINWEGSMPDEKINIRRNWVGPNYFSFYDIDLISGRTFSENYANEKGSCIINETAAKKLGWFDPIGKTIDNDQYTIIGVIKDFHVNSVFSEIPPCLFLPKNASLNESNAFSIRINENVNQKKTKEQIESAFEKYLPRQIIELNPFGGNSNDENIRVYNGVVKTFAFFALVTILLSLFGLFGLVSYTLKRRTKEVGIRKSLGSKVYQIYFLLARDYTLIIVIAIIAAIPLALLFLMIDPAAYKPPLNWPNLILGLICIIVVSLGSVGYHTLKASITNPVKALRYE